MDCLCSSTLFLLFFYSQFTIHTFLQRLRGDPQRRLAHGGVDPPRVALVAEEGVDDGLRLTSFLEERAGGVAEAVKAEFLLLPAVAAGGHERGLFPALGKRWKTKSRSG